MRVAKTSLRHSTTRQLDQARRISTASSPRFSSMDSLSLSLSLFLSIAWIYFAIKMRGRFDRETISSMQYNYTQGCSMFTNFVLPRGVTWPGTISIPRIFSFVRVVRSFERGPWTRPAQGCFRNEAAIIDLAAAAAVCPTSRPRGTRSIDGNNYDKRLNRKSPAAGRKNWTDSKLCVLSPSVSFVVSFDRSRLFLFFFLFFLSRTIVHFYFSSFDSRTKRSYMAQRTYIDCFLVEKSGNWAKGRRTALNE